MAKSRETKSKRRTRLLGKYAGDQNIEIETKYGQEWLACVASRVNPATGVPCAKNDEIRSIFDPHEYGWHEYRFKTGSSGWIAGPNSVYAEATREKSYEDCDGMMYCRDCSDTYEPSAEPRKKAALDGFVAVDTLMRLAAERGGKWINVSDPGDLRAFVDRMHFRTDSLAGMAADLRAEYGTDIRRMEKIAADLARWSDDALADMVQYVGIVRDRYGDGYKELHKACRAARAARNRGERHA